MSEVTCASFGALVQAAPIAKASASGRIRKERENLVFMTSTPDDFSGTYLQV
jgi:hypothetical protein